MTSPDRPDPLGLHRLGHADSLLEVKAQRWHDGQPESRLDQVVEEIPVVIVYNRVPHVVMMATPQDLEDFALGFSLTEELIRTPADLEG
ncbi:MAG: formate dehydrogenase accessory sulfurtransferase FdhD, partial [Gemmatimonadales bacterium]|nr:formate dehydrogenase accessory sulfurtransferase FdhD [Gemmatimonadales bacterium]